MAKEKLLILSDWYLPGTKAGGPIRSLYALISLLKNEFDIYLITRNTDLGSETPYPDLESNQWIGQDAVNYYYCSDEKLTVSHLQALIKYVNAKTIYLNSFWSYYFSIAIIELKHKGRIDAKIILAPRGMLGKGALEIKPFKKKIYLLNAWLRNLYVNIHFHATNIQEKNDILKHFRKAKISVIPNLNSLPAFNVGKEKTSGSLKLFYLSRIVPIKNLDFALTVLKHISADCKIEYSIYGNMEDTGYWHSCEKLIKELPAHINVRYKHEIPFNNIGDILSKEHCLFLPTKNENFGHSIVESLLSGCPAIISNLTPWNDIQESGAGFALPLNQQEKFTTVIEAYARKNNKEFEEDTNCAVHYISRKINIPLSKEKYIQLFYGER
jgi:glycosyltransferase involved in cell wall biosynthesis